MNREDKIKLLKAYAAGDTSALEELRKKPFHFFMPDEFFAWVVGKLNTREKSIQKVAADVMHEASKCKTESEAQAFLAEWRRTHQILKQ